MQSEVYPIFKKHELTREEYLELAKLAGDKNVEIAASIFDLDTLDWYLENTSSPFIKIASGDITFKRLLKKAGGSDTPVILSTAAATGKEIRRAIKWLGPNDDTFLLHCTPFYPTSNEDINLKRMLDLQEKFNLPVGFSDHSTSRQIPLQAAGAGAIIWERHITVDRNMEGPEHGFSMTVDELKRVVTKLKNKKFHPPGVKNGGIAETALDKDYRKNARRSLFAARKIEPGEKFKKDSLIELRPNRGISAERIEEISRHRAKRTFNKGELIER